MNDQLERQLNGSMKLVELTRELAGHHELDEILDSITRIACEALSCERATLYRYDDDRKELYTDSTTTLEPPQIRSSVNLGVTGWVARTQSVANIPRPDVDARWNSSIDRQTGFQTRNILAAPVMSSETEKLLGVLQILNKTEGSFEQFDEELLQAFAAHAGTALERSILLEELRQSHELQIAVDMGRQIQTSFLPDELPDIPGYQIAAWWHPAESVSGDYYDILQLPDGRIGIVIADVSGHGVGPSLIMASVRAMLHVLARSFSDPSQIIEMVSETITPDLREGRFITFLMAALNLQTHELIYSNAGHGPAMHLEREHRQFETLQSTGLPMGFGTSLGLPTNRTLHLEAGDLLLLATDGLTEVHDADRQMFGLPRLQSLIIQNRRLPAPELIKTISSAVLDFTGGRYPSDDVTVVAIERKL